MYVYDERIIIGLCSDTIIIIIILCVRVRAIGNDTAAATASSDIQ